MGVIDLGIGRPNRQRLPVRELATATARVLAHADGELLQYGPDPGQDLLRTCLAQFLSAQYARPVDAEALVITYGASHALDLVLSRFTQPGDTVLVEDPTYFFALDILRGRGLTAVPVHIDQQGIVLADFQRQLNQYRPRLLYTVPTFHNPTGIVYSSSRRQEMMNLAQQHDCLVLADEVYHLLCEPPRPQPLRAYSTDNVISVSAFSKIFAPGLRLGWVEASRPHIRRLLECGVLRSGGAVSPFVSTIVADLVTTGVQDEVLNGLRSFYRDRIRWGVTALREHLPEEITFDDPGGGFFLWLRAPERIDLEQLRDTARGIGVDYRAGPSFSCCGSFRNCLRLCCTYYSDEETQEGFRRLGHLLKLALSSAAV